MTGSLKISLKNNKLLQPFVREYQRLKQQYKKPVRGKNNIVINKGNCSNVKFDIEGNNNSIEIKPGSVLSGITIYIRGNNHTLTIEENCYFKGGSITFEDDNCRITIGKNTSIESALLGVTEPNRSISIGQNCMLSSGIEIRTGDSHSIIDNVTKKRINYAQDIEVGEHVWIGANATLLKGVRIGDHSIIGTGALVTTDIPSHCLAGGIPAKVLKTNIDWLRERIYEND